MPQSKLPNFTVPFDLTEYIGHRIKDSAMIMKVLQVGASRIWPERVKVWCNAKKSRQRCKVCPMLKYKGKHEFKMTGDEYDRILLFLKTSDLEPTEKVRRLAGIDREECRTWRYEFTYYMSVRPVLVEWKGKSFCIYYIGQTELERGKEYAFTAMVVADDKDICFVVDDRGLQKIDQEADAHAEWNAFLPVLDSRGSLSLGN